MSSPPSLPEIFLRKILARAGEQPRLQDAALIAVTGWGQEEDRRRSREAGFRHHLVKPVDPAELERLLASLGPAAC